MYIYTNIYISYQCVSIIPQQIHVVTLEDPANHVFLV